jgi:hypothetical protein
MSWSLDLLSAEAVPVSVPFARRSASSSPRPGLLQSSWSGEEAALARVAASGVLADQLWLEWSSSSLLRYSTGTGPRGRERGTPEAATPGELREERRF